MAKNEMEKTGFNTQPPEGGWVYGAKDVCYHCKFQHTAARRRLVIKITKLN